MNRKARTILQAIAVHAPTGPIVEIGSVRCRDEIASDGYSTVYLAYIAVATRRAFDTVDNDPNTIAIARELTADTPTNVHQQDGATWLRRHHTPIAVLYLDGALEPAETLSQYRAATMLDHGALVLIDDAQHEPGLDQGKATAVTGELKHDGFTVTIRDTEPGYKMVVAWR